MTHDQLQDDGGQYSGEIEEDAEDSFIIQDDEEEGYRDITLPPTVASLLRIRSKLEEGSPNSLETSSSSKVARVPTKFEAADLTDSRKTFDYNLINAQLPPTDAIGVETYLDLKDYDLNFKEYAERPYGGMRLIYAFYSRLYQKLIKQQKGIKIPFFSPPIPAEGREFGFREALDFRQDFKLTQVVGRRELESIFTTVCGMRTQEETFRAGMTFDQFVDFIALIALSDDRHCPKDETPIQRISRFIRKQRFHKGVEVKIALHNIWRDRHFWRLREDTDFEREARYWAMKATPIHKVRALRSKLRSYRKPEWSSFRNYLSQFEYLDAGSLWEKFDGPFVDMGTSLVGQTKKFKIILRNLRHHVMRFHFEVHDIGPIRLPIPDLALDGLGPGQECTIPIEPFVNDEGEYTGRIRITARTAAKEVYPFEIPIYMCAKFPHEGEGPTGKELPLRAPQPFQNPPAELTYPQVTEGNDIQTLVHSVCVDGSTPTFRTFVLDVCSNSNLNPRKPRLYGLSMSTPPHSRPNSAARPGSAPPTRTGGGRLRPTTAPVHRTAFETPRTPQERPRSAQVAPARPWSSKQRQLTNPESRAPVRVFASTPTTTTTTAAASTTAGRPQNPSCAPNKPFTHTNSGGYHMKCGQMIPKLGLKKRPSSAQVQQIPPGGNNKSLRPQSAMSRIDVVQWPGY